MSFTLSQFKAALNTNAGAAADATVDFASKAFDATKSTAVKTGSAVKGVMPATNKKVDSIAAKFNSRLNNVEMGQRVQGVWINQIAQATGVTLADEADVIEALLEADKEEEVAKKAQAIKEVVVNPELISVIGMFAEKLLGINPFAQPADEEVVEEEEDDDYELPVLNFKEEEVDEEDVPAEVVKKAKVKKQPKKEVVKEEVVEDEGLSAPTRKKSGRKKLGMSAPLAD
jgi:hypothetical protein